VKERSPLPKRSQWPKLRALGEVLLVYLGLKILVKVYFSLPLAAREVDHLHWPYSVQLVSLVAALAMVILLRRDREEYGLVPNWHQDIRLGGGLALLFIGLSIAVMGLWGGLVSKASGPGTVVSTVVFQFFLSGIGEEILYRGYIQSRLNQAFGRPIELGGIRFGAGLFVTALLFGLAHSLSGFNPFVPSFRFDLFYGVVTGIWALLFGLLREKTGSILSAGILHGHEAVIENFVVTLPGQLAYVTGFVIAFGVLLGAPVLRKKSSQEPEMTTT
jgi:hypothetical protein